SAQPITVTKANPTDAGWQPLEADAFSGHVQPVMQVWIVWDQLLDLGVGPVDVLRIAGQGRPAERADAAAEQRPNVGRYKAREIKGICHTDFIGHLADIVAVIKGRHAHFLEFQHSLD